MLYPPGNIVVLSRQNSLACIVSTVRVNCCVSALRLHPDWGSLVTVWVYACVCPEEACRWKLKAGARNRRLSPSRAAIPAAAGGRRASERPVGTPATFLVSKRVQSASQSVGHRASWVFGRDCRSQFGNLQIGSCRLVWTVDLSQTRRTNESTRFVWSARMYRVWG